MKCFGTCSNYEPDKGIASTIDYRIACHNCDMKKATNWGCDNYNLKEKPQESICGICKKPMGIDTAHIDHVDYGEFHFDCYEHIFDVYAEVRIIEDRNGGYDLIRSILNIIERENKI